MKSTLKTGIVGILVGILASMVLIASQPSNAAQANKHRMFPKSVPAEARAAYTAELVPETSPNVYVSYYYDPVEDEYTIYADHYDPAAEYGWSPCGPSECGKIVVGKGGKLRMKLKSSETLIYGYFSYFEETKNGGPYYGNGGFSLSNSWALSDRLSMDDRVYWRSKWINVDFGSASFGAYSTDFEAPPVYEPCCLGSK